MVCTCIAKLHDPLLLAKVQVWWFLRGTWDMYVSSWLFSYLSPPQLLFLSIHSSEGVQIHLSLFYGLTSTDSEWSSQHWEYHWMCDKSLPPHHISGPTSQIIFPLIVFTFFNFNWQNHIKITICMVLQKYSTPRVNIFGIILHSVMVQTSWYLRFIMVVWCCLPCVKVIFLQIHIFI